MLSFNDSLQNAYLRDFYVDWRPKKKITVLKITLITISKYSQAAFGQHRSLEVWSVVLFLQLISYDSLEKDLLAFHRVLVKTS